MKERPILFSAPMVRAIIEGRKTQTRRVVKPQPKLDWSIYHGEDWNFKWMSNPSLHVHLSRSEWFASPYGAPGDHLWVRETFGVGRVTDFYYYRADPHQEHKLKACFDNWKPSIFMPRKASRITLEVTSVRVERVQDISEKDAIAEGVDHGWRDVPCGRMKLDPRAEYAMLWDSINAKRSFGWDANPWVFVIEFCVIKK